MNCAWERASIRSGVLEEFPADIKKFIADHVSSVAQLELLLLLRESSDRAWSADDVAKALYTTPQMMATQLADLNTAGVLAPDTRGDGFYRYAPRTPELADTIMRLAEMYKVKRVTVISAIYAEPVDPLRSFADAFRFRKEK